MNKRTLFFLVIFLPFTGFTQIGWSNAISIDNNASNADYLDMADIDNDGDLDVVAIFSYLSPDGARIVWYENNGSGSFLTSNLITNYGSSNNETPKYLIYCTDVDQDGKTDIIYGYREGSYSPYTFHVKWLRNLGSGNFSDNTILSTTNTLVKIYIGDLTGDGKVDIIVPSSLTQLSLYTNLGTSFSNSTLYTASSNVSINMLGDFDDDGDLDILCRLNDVERSWLENNGSGGIINNHVFPFSMYMVTSAVICEDYDNNGYKDFFALDNNNYAALIYKTAPDTYSQYSWANEGGFSTNFKALFIDIDNDGLKDLVRNNPYAISWYKGAGGPTFGSRTDISCISTPTSVKAVDIDNDSDIDLLAIDGNTIIWFENNPEPIITTQPSSVNKCVGSNTFFQSDAVYGVNYQWQANTGSGYYDLINGSEYSGVGTSSLSVTNIPQSFNGIQYRCRISNTGNVVYTNPATLTVYPLPNASFTAFSPVEVNSNSLVEYTGETSINDNFDWSWGGATTSPSGQGPHNVNWTTVGTKEITMSITNENGCTSLQDTQYVVVNPSSNFSIDVAEICLLEPVIINYNGLSDAELHVFNWDLDTGIIVSGSNPMQVYWMSPGKKYISLQVTEDGYTSNITLDSIIINPLPVIELGLDINLFQGEDVNLTANVSGGTPPYPSLMWNTAQTSLTINVSPTDTTTYYFYVTDYKGCEGEDSVTVNVFTIYQDQEICLVTVDPSVAKNKVMWEKTPGLGIESFYIYKELASNVYSLIGIVPFEDPSVFIDYASDPAAHGDKYKITIIDDSGFESEIDSCLYHKTINLTLSNVGSTMALNWDYYEVEDNGFVPPKYYIYRGESITNMELIDSVSGSFNSYNDNGVYEVFNYLVGTVRESCGGYAKTSYTTFSNVEDNQDIILSMRENNGLPLSIYPNPATDIVYISLPQSEKGEVEVRVTDVTGKTTQNLKLKTQDCKIALSNLSQGVYFVEVRGEKTYRGKVVVE